MESDWCEVGRISVLPPPSPHPISTSITALSFDNSQELIWTGNEYGRVTSFFGSELQKYTSFKAHEDGAVRNFLFNERGVVSLGARSLHMSARRGIAKWHLTHEKFQDLRCMSYTSKGTSEILVTGGQRSMLTVNVDRGQILSEIPCDDDYTIMRRDRLICGATTQGNVNIIDPNSFKIIKTINAHQAAISDIDAANNVLLTCGYSARPTGFMLDPIVQIFDLRTFKGLPPVPFPAGAAFCRMHPKMSTTGIIASQTGQFQVIDIANPNVVNLRQANVSSYVCSLELAPSGDALALTDQECTLQLWGSPEKTRFTEISNATEWPTPSRTQPAIDFTESTPLNSVGMPYYRENLLSAWPSHMVFETGKIPPKIPQDVLSKMVMKHGCFQAPNPRKTRRYQVETIKAVDRPLALQAPKFRSEKARDGKENEPEQPSPWSQTPSELRPFDVPVMYQTVEIKYSKFGVDDFDFEYYNKTTYSGLETHITNSYSNALLQLFKFTPLLRNLALQHTAGPCLAVTCLLCELGFLFDMLDKANGQNCQATNFLKTFSSIQQAAALGLFEDLSSRGSQSLGVVIQSLNRFLLEKVLQEYKNTRPLAQDMEQALVTSSMTNIRCVCGTETIRPSNNVVNELSYPKPHKNKPIQSFSTVLKHSFDRDGHTRGWCDKCRRYQNLTTRKQVRKPPKIMLLNAAANTTDSKLFWAERNWLPEEIGIVIQENQFFSYQGEELKTLIERGKSLIRYELVGVVAEIHGEADGGSHLVSLVDVSRAQKMPTEKKWHIFNDFLVRTVTKEEAINFAPLWKLPAILCYQMRSPENVIDDSWKNSLDTSILFSDTSVNNKSKQVCKRLKRDETPGPDTIVAIDAEFVALQMEEMEIKADGTRETIRPSRLSLARVSVLRGIGEEEVDYLTLFSGIEPGDLDLQKSTHPLSSLKLVYKKLWLLLNLGCVFVGHGLLKDFRIINIHVPKEQVIDTVDIFFKKTRQRKLSLRFLAWYLLHENIQTGNHDSIEDANTALRLYKKYLEFMDAGIFEQMLTKIYQEGKYTNFKPPVENETGTSLSTSVGTLGSHIASGEAVSRTATPPVMKDSLVVPGEGSGGQGTIFGNQISSPTPGKIKKWP